MVVNKNANASVIGSLEGRKVIVQESGKRDGVRDSGERVGVQYPNGRVTYNKNTVQKALIKLGVKSIPFKTKLNPLREAVAQFQIAKKAAEKKEALFRGEFIPE